MSNDVSLGLAHEAGVTLRKAGATKDFYVEISKSLSLAQKLVVLVAGKPCSYTTTIIPDLNRALKEAGYQESDVPQGLSPRHFPAKGASEYELTVEVFDFGSLPYYLSSDNVIELLNKAGYRPGRMEEVLALLVAQPKLAREEFFPVIGSPVRGLVCDDELEIVTFSAGVIEIDSYDTNCWNENCRWVAVRKADG